MDELESDIEHLEEVLRDFKGCDECRKDHERLLAYLKELLSFRKAMGADYRERRTRLRSGLRQF